MAVTTVPFVLQGGSHGADLFRQAASSLVPPGGGIITAGDLNVAPTGTPSMAVTIGVGRIWVPGTNLANVTGGNFSNQAMYYLQNDAAITRTVTTSDPTNPRIDVVYAVVNDQNYAGTLNNADILIAAGVPTAGASYPTNAPALPANSKALAWIYVANGASSISASNITQLATAGIPAVPVDRANTTLVGSATGLLGKLQNNANQPLTQSGTTVVTTDASGNAGITYPVAFPNGVISAVVCNGDHSTGNLLMAVAGSPFTQNLTTLYVNVKTAHTGAILASSTVRVNWVATGW